MSGPEIEVEGEPWTGLVAVRDRKRQGPGEYALVRAEEWCRHPKMVTLWRGPNKTDETVKLDQLNEVACRSVLVDGLGFYTCLPDDDPRYYPCPGITEEFVDEVRRESEEVLTDLADEQAAQGHSYVESEDLGQRLDGGEIFVIATFGDAVSVNGEYAIPGRTDKPPRRWVLLEREGGRIPDGGESEHEKDTVAEILEPILTEKLRMRIDPWSIRRALDMIYEKDHIVWGAGAGDIEVWVSQKMARKYEAWREEEEARIAEDRRRRAEEEYRKSMEAFKKRVRRGGFPHPKDWSPRGRLPWER